MSEVVDNRDTALFAPDFHAPFDVFKSSQRVLNPLAAHVPSVRRDDHGEAVKKVELSQQRSLKLAPRLLIAKDFKSRQSASEVRVANLPACVFSCAKCFQLGKQLRSERLNHRAHVGTIPPGNQSPILRHEVHETAKSELHRVKIFVDIGVIEFDVVDDSQLRQVMHELRTLVEVGSVVLVGLDDHVVTLRHTKAAAEILRHAAD